MEDKRIYVALKNLEGEIIDADVIQPETEKPEEKLRGYLEKGYKIVTREEIDDYLEKSIPASLRNR